MRDERQGQEQPLPCPDLERIDSGVEKALAHCRRNNLDSETPCRVAAESDEEAGDAVLQRASTASEEAGDIGMQKAIVPGREGGIEPPAAGITNLTGDFIEKYTTEEASTPTVSPPSPSPVPLNRTDPISSARDEIPGAYALGPAGDATGMLERPQWNATASNRNDDDENGLVEARQVPEPEAPIVSGEATEVSLPELQQRRRSKERERKCEVFGFASVAAAIIVGVVILLAVAFRQNNDDARRDELVRDPFQDEAIEAGSKLHNTTGADKPHGQALNLGEIPSYTLAALEDPFSPQSQAHHWLSNHKNLTNLPQWRQRQLYALSCLYYSFNGPNWLLGLNKDWLDDTRSECQWFSNMYGFFSESGTQYTEREVHDLTCNEDGQFHTIQMSNAAKWGYSFSGPAIPPEIGWLPALKYISFENCGYSNWSAPQMFPPQFYQLTNLEFLNIGKNLANKPIPSELGLLTKLTRLGLHAMNTKGIVPTELGLLSRMERLDLYSNQLTGTIPTELVSSYRMKLHNNLLSGAVPSELATIPPKEGLTLHQNPKLAGQLPTELGLVTQLQGYLKVENTSLTGTVPDNFCRLQVKNCTYEQYPTKKIKQCELSFDCGSKHMCGCNCDCS